MPRAYADLVDLIEQKLQDTGNAEFSAAMIDYQVEECLKEIGARQPHIVPVIFTIESRHGKDTAGTASTLTDSTKGQFVAADATEEKVVYNFTDHTWAVVTGYTDANTLSISADIMDSGDTYYIFNKRCRNNRQIYIGDSFDPYSALRAEYPCNEWPRNWRNIKVVEHDILEIILDIEPDDSDSTLSNLGRTEVLVEFKRPHVLSQLTDWVGEVNNASGYSAGDSSMAIDGLQATGTIEEGEEFQLENHRSLYTVTADATVSSNAATISFWPELEAAVSNNDGITFVKSTLSPDLEDILAELCTARLLINQAPKYFKTIGPGGAKMWQSLMDLGEHKLAETLTRLSRISPRRSKRSYPAE